MSSGPNERIRPEWPFALLFSLLMVTSMVAAPVGATLDQSARVGGTPADIGTDAAFGANGGTTTYGTATGGETERGNTGFESWYMYRNGVNLANGNLYRSSTDLVIGARGDNLEFTRSYNSHGSHEHGPFGFGWTHNYAMRLDVTGDDAVFVDADGSKHVFEASDGAFDPPAGLRARLESGDDGYDLRWTDGRTVRFDGEGVLQWTEDRNGNRVTLEYADGELVTIVDDAGQALTLTYNDEGRIERLEDPLGRNVTYEYGLGDLETVTDVMGEETTYEYFENHKLRKITESTGTMTTVDYYVASDRVRRIGSGQTEIQCTRSGTEFTYDYANDSVAFTNGITGTETTVELNEAGNPVALASADGSVDWAWDDGNPVEVTNETGTYRFAYDDHGNLLERTGPGGTITREWAVTDTADRYLAVKTSETDAAGRTTTYEYDENGNPTRVTNPAGDDRELAYDASGNLVSKTDFAGHETTYGYDGRGFLTNVTGPTGGETTYHYDAVGRLLEEADPRGNSVEYAYNARNDLLNVTDPAGNVIEFVYDEHGTQTGVVRQIGESGTESTLSTTESNVGRSAYDIEIDGDVITYRSDEHVLERRLNARGELAEEAIDYGPFTVSLEYEYDERGNLETIVTDDGEYAFEYDAFDRVSKATGPDGSWLEYAYDATGRVTETNASNGVTTTYTRDAGGKLTALRAINATGETVLEESYGYDPAGNLERVTDADGTSRFDYDALNRLVNARYPSGETVEYTYDAIGNRLSKTVNGSETIEYDYGGDGELLEAGDTSYEYDENGSLAARVVDEGDGSTERTEYEYGPGGRLESVTLPNGDTVSYTYLPDGERASRTVDGETTFFSYSDYHLLGEYDETGALERGYLQGAGLDTPIARHDEATGEAYFFHVDARNDVRAVTDDASAVANRYRYDAFGAVERAREAVANPYRFGARRFDSAADLYYNRQRYYDPEVGRFTRADPAGTVAGVNQYVYADNNPTTYTDPFGYDTWDGGISISGVSPGKLGVISIGSKGDMSGSLKNSDTGQGCSISGTMTTYGLSAELSAVSAELGAMPMVIGGPTCGESLPGMSIVCGGFAGAVEAAAGVEVGAFACGETRSGGISGGAGSAKTGVVAGAGAGVTLFVRIDITDSECSCVEECDDCKDGGPTPRPPGGDHPDDNHDVSVQTYASRYDRTAVAEYGYRDGSIAMLDRGFAAEFGDFLTDEGIAYDTVSWNVPQDDLERYDLLILPSGSLTGLSALDSFGEKLEGYVDGGGTLLVMPQQRGYHWDPVPGDLRAYGWLEDQSCQFSSVGIDKTCPAFATESVGSTASLNVDGYFTDYPETADVLLTRTKNAQPAMLSYDRGAGRVIATTAYSDWAYGHNAASSADERILRDTVRWAKQNADIPTYNRGDDVDLDTEVDSYVDLAVDRVEISVIDPDGEVVETIDDAGSLDPLESENLSASFTVPTDATYGIWDVAYAFENDTYGTVQRLVENDSLAITRYEEGDSGWQSGDSNVSVSVNSDAERYALGSNATFEITVQNAGDRTENVTLYWAYPHNSRYGNASVYGVGGTSPGEKSTLNETLELAAGEDETIVHEIPIVNTDGRDRLWLEYYEERDGETTYVGKVSRGFYTFSPTVDVALETGGTTYTSGEDVPIDVELTGEGVDNATVETRVVAPGRTLVFQNQTEVSLDGSVNLTYEAPLSSPADGGRYAIVTDVFDGDGEKIGYQSAGFDVPEGVKFNASLPATIGESNALAFDVENVNAAPFEDATVDASFVDPDGNVVWTDSASVDVARNETERVAFAMDLEDFAFGEYALRYTFDVGSKHVERARTYENGHSIAADFDESWYRQRDDVGVNATISNDGDFETDFTATVAFPEAGFEDARELELAPGERADVNTTFTVPATVSAGEHDVAVTLEDESEYAETFSFVVPESELAIGDVDDEAAAGADLTVTVDNRGGVDTVAECSIELVGPQGLRLDERDLDDTVRAGGSVTTTVSVPDQAITGQYFVLVGCTDGSTGEKIRTVAAADVDGLDADVTSSTDADVYGTDDTVAVTAEITNHGDAIDDGRLHLEIADAAAGSESDDESAGSTADTSAQTGDDSAASLESSRDAGIDTASVTKPSPSVVARTGAYQIPPTASMAPAIGVGTTVDGESTIASTPPATIQAAPTMTQENITIDNDTVWEDETVVLTGNLTVDATGSLTLRNTTVQFDVPYTKDGEMGLDVREGGELRILEGSTVETLEHYAYYFRVRSGSTFAIRDSTVRDAGGGSYYSPLEEKGLYVAADDALIENATLVENDGVVLDGTNNVTITDSTISETMVRLRDSRASVLDGNDLREVNGQPMVRLENASDNAITNNEFTDFSDEAAIGLDTGSTGNLLSGNAIHNYDDGTGISVDETSARTVVRGNEIANVTTAIDLRSGDGELADNIVTYSEEEGIYVSGVNTTITNNTISDSEEYGLFLHQAENATLRENAFTGHGLHVEGSGSTAVPPRPSSVPERRYYDHDVDTSNTVNGGPIYYLSDEADTTLVNDGGMTWLVNATNVTTSGSGTVSTVFSDNVTIRDIIATDGFYGVFAGYSHDVTVENSTLTDNEFGVVLQGADDEHSSGNVVRSNTISHNRDDNVWAVYWVDTVVSDNVGGYAQSDGDMHFYGYGQNLTVSGNEITSTNDRWAVILVEGSSNNISDNRIEGGGNGIDVDSGSDNVVSGNVISNASGYGIDLETSESTIANNTITHVGSAGIRVWRADGTHVVENTISNVGQGYGYGANEAIYATGSDNLVVRGNDVSNNQNEGIRLNSGYSAVVRDNVGSGNARGIVISGDRDHVLSGNDVSGTVLDISLDGTQNVTLRDNALSNGGLRVNPGGSPNLNNYRHDIDTSNTYRGKPVYYHVDATDVAVPDDAGSVWFINVVDGTAAGSDAATVVASENVTVRNVNTANRIVHVWETTDSVFENISVTGSGSHGVFLEGSTGNELRNVDVQNVDGYGVYLYSSSDNNTLENVTVDGSESSASSHGIYLREVDHVSLSNATLRNSNRGIYLYDSNHAVLTDVVATNNTNAGLYVTSTTNATVANLTVSDNGDHGAYFSSVVDSTISNVTATRNGDFESWINDYNGVHVIRSDRNELSDLVATGNDGAGVSVAGTDNVVASLLVKENDGSGFESSAEGITVTNVTTTANAGIGLLLDDATDATISNITATANAGSGLYLDGASDNDVTDSLTVENGGSGVYLFRSYTNTVANVTAHNNTAEGVDIYNSGNNTVANVTATENDRGLAIRGYNVNQKATRNHVSDSRLAENTEGAYFSQAADNTLVGTVIESNDEYGIRLPNSENNSIYDNYFDNPGAVAEADEDTAVSDPAINRWNVTKTPGENVVGGPFVGGNYWATYDGEDTDVDGLGDTDVPYNVSGSLNVGDYHPLVSEHDEPASRVVWETNVSVDVAEGDTETVSVDVPASELRGEGKRKLSATLYADSNQTIAFEDPPFYVLDGETTLTMNTDEGIYATNDTVTIEGELVNDGDASEAYELSVEKDGVEILAESVTLEAGGRHEYVVTTDADAPFSLSATAGGVTIDDEVRVVDPSVTATAVAPDTVGRAPFLVGAELENDGSIPVDLEVSIGPGAGSVHSVTLEPGETKRVTEERTIVDDTAFSIDVTGDVGETLSADVSFGESASTTVSPEPVYAPGAVEIPYSVENTGALDLEVDIEFSVDGETERETLYASSGTTADGTVAFDLEAGTHTVTYETPFETGSATVDVRERDRLELTTDVSSNAADGTLETTLELENVGSNDLNGTIAVDATISSVDRGFDVDAGERETVTVTVPISEGVDPGEYDVSVEATTGDDVLARADETFEVAGPRLDVTTVPGEETYELGELATWNYTITNEGDAEGRAVLNVSAIGMSEAGTVQRDDAWVAPGESRTLSVAVRIADDIEEGSYDAQYELVDETGAVHDAGETAFDVAGTNVSVDADLDEHAYEVGENATLTMSVTNERASTVELFARTQFNGFDERTPFSLDGQGDTETIEVEVPIVEGTDEKIFFGVYHADGRSIHIDGRYPRTKTGNVTLYTDAERYEPGETVTVTVEPDESGSFDITAPASDFISSRTVTAGQTETFEFDVLPSATGTYYVRYALNGDASLYPFDVDGYSARVTGAQFADDEYEAGETIDLDLELEPTRDVDATVTGTLLDDDGVAVATVTEDVELETGGTDVRVSVDVPDDAAGVHAIAYEIDAEVEYATSASNVRASATGSRQVLAVNGVEYLEIEGTEAPNQPPVAAVEYAPSEPVVDEGITFDASQSNDSDGSIETYEWDVDGDGTADASGVETVTEFASPGDYAVTLTVTDDDGATDETVVTVTVTEANAGGEDEDEGDDNTGGGGGGIGGDGDGDDDEPPVNDSEGTDEPTVVLTGDGEAIVGTATNVKAGTSFTLEYGREGYSVGADGTSVERLTVTMAEDANVEIVATPTGTPPGGAPGLENAIVLQYVDFAHNASDDSFEGGIVEFNVTTDRLTEAGIDGESISLYGRDGDGWSELETTLLAETDDRAVYRANVPTVAPIAIGAGQPSFVLRDVHLGAESGVVNEPTSVRGQVVNEGSVEGGFTVELVLDETVVESKTVTVPAGESREVEFELTIAEPGTYEVHLNDESAGGLTIDAGVDDSESADDISLGPLGGALVSIVALLSVAVAIARRREREYR